MGEWSEVCVYLVHGPRWNQNRVSQELHHGPALHPVLLQQLLPLLPAQVPALLSDWVLLSGHVQSLLFTQLEGRESG